VTGHHHEIGCRAGGSDGTTNNTAVPTMYGMPIAGIATIN
jgi:hypothetical protein